MNKTTSRDSFLPLLLLAVFVAVVVFLFLTRAAGDFYFAGKVSNNVHHIYEHARCLGDGNLPYSRGHLECVAAMRPASAAPPVFEYPPGAAVVLALLGVFPRCVETFQVYFVGANLLMFALGFMLLMNQAEALRAAGGPDRRVAMTVACTLCALAAGPVAVVSFDLMPAVLTLCALVLALQGRAGWSGVCLGLAVVSKGYALALLPVLAYVWRGRGGLWRGGLWFAGVVCAFAGAALAVSPENFIASFAYHAERGVELNSIYGALLAPGKYFGMAAGTDFNHGGWNVTGPAAEFLASLSGPVLAGLLCLALWLGWRVARRMDFSRAPDAAAADWIMRWAIAVVAAFIVGFKVGSPQFLCWLVPLVPFLVLRPGGWIPVLLFVAAGHASTAVFPHLWSAYAYRLAPLPAALLVLKYAGLIVMAAWLMRSPPGRAGQGDST